MPVYIGISRRGLRFTVASLALVLPVSAVSIDAPLLRNATPPAYAGVTSGDAGSPDVVMNADGDAIAVYQRKVDNLFQIEARYRAAGGAWGPVKLLAGGSPTLAPPRVAIDDAGNAAAIWMTQVDGQNRVQAARRSAGGVWGAVKILSPAGASGSDPDIVMDADGNTTAVWTRSDGSHTRVETARRPHGGAWSAVSTVGPAGEAVAFPALATSPGGVTMVAWLTGGRTKASRRPAGGNWGAAVPVTPDGTIADYVDIAMDGQARATVLWRGPVDATISMQARRRTGQGWGPVEVLSPPGSQASAPGNVAMSAGGDTYVVWAGVNSGHNRALARSRPAGGNWGPLVRLGAVGQSSDSVRVAVNARGDAVAAWTRFFGDSWVEASYKPAGQDWGLAHEISDKGRASGGPVVALGNDRTAVALFSGFENTIFRIQSSTRTPGGGWSNPVFFSGLP